MVPTLLKAKSLVPRDQQLITRLSCSEERKITWHYRRGKRVAETKSEKWVWISTLEAKTFSIRLVRQLGHERWRLENNAWCDLTQHWAFKHGFLHACKDRPQCRDAQGQLQPLHNHGLPAVTLILCVAFVLCSAFARLHSKLFRRYRLSVLWRSLASSIARCGAFSRPFESQTDDRFAPLFRPAESLSDCQLRSSWKTLPPIGFPFPDPLI